MHPHVPEKVSLCKAYSLRYLVAQMMRLVALRCITRDLCVCSTAGRISQRRLFSAAQDLLASRLDFLCGGLPSSLSRSPRKGQNIICELFASSAWELHRFVRWSRRDKTSRALLVLQRGTHRFDQNKLVIVCVCVVYIHRRMYSVCGCARC